MLDEQPFHEYLSNEVIGEPLALAVGRQVASLRLGRGLSAEAVADIAELHRTYIRLIEEGDRQLSIAAGSRLANAFGMRLSDLLLLAEAEVEGRSAASLKGRTVDRAKLIENQELVDRSGLDSEWVARAIEVAYSVVDNIDERMTHAGSPPLAELVELANLSSMLGNLIGAGLAAESGGAYVRNAPHTYPDLLGKIPSAESIEIKMALEKNLPKGHLPKPGPHFVFRYVLADRDGNYVKGRDSRGSVPWVWEARFGALSIEDFRISNTAGDSGKTAVVATQALKDLPLVYRDLDQNPYGSVWG